MFVCVFPPIMFDSITSNCNIHEMYWSISLIIITKTEKCTHKIIASNGFYHVHSIFQYYYWFDTFYVRMCIIWNMTETQTPNRWPWIYAIYSIILRFLSHFEKLHDVYNLFSFFCLWVCVSEYMYGHDFQRMKCKWFWN